MQLVDLLLRTTHMMPRRLSVGFKVHPGLIPLWIAQCCAVALSIPGASAGLLKIPPPGTRLIRGFLARRNSPLIDPHTIPGLLDTIDPSRCDVIVDVLSGGPEFGEKTVHFSLNGRKLTQDCPPSFLYGVDRGGFIVGIHEGPGQDLYSRVLPLSNRPSRANTIALEAASSLLALLLLQRAGIPLTLQNQLSVQTPQSFITAGQEFLSQIPAWGRFLAETLGLRRSRETWGIAARPISSIAPWNAASLPHYDWRWSPLFHGHQAADPFVVEDDGRRWLFFEDIPPHRKHGRLAVASLDQNGNTADPAVILERPYHLSYPFVFRHDDQWWMIPECADHGTLDLYEAIRFPHEWRHSRTIFEGVRFIDTTLLHHENHWYCFATVLGSGRAHVSVLFHAPDLESPWRLHPASPISLDARFSRGAGAVFRFGGKLIRPVQDCSLRYGYAVRFQEILELSPVACREQVIGTLKPEWYPSMVGTHTISFSNGVLVLDGLRRRILRTAGA